MAGDILAGGQGNQDVQHVIGRGDGIIQEAVGYHGPAAAAGAREFDVVAEGLEKADSGLSDGWLVVGGEASAKKDDGGKS